MRATTIVATVAGAAVGIAASFGHTAGIGAMVLMPALAMARNRRRAAGLVAFSYYAAASWPIIPSARNFFGPAASMPEAVTLWIVASLLLAIPWLALWSACRRQLLWRIPQALTMSAVPPLGIIGCASPLTSGGHLGRWSTTMIGRSTTAATTRPFAMAFKKSKRSAKAIPKLMC
jgi:hypothetical protein